MSQKVKGGKFLRLVNIIANHPDRLRLIAAMKQSYAGATEITVKDIGGKCLDYTPVTRTGPGKTLRIPKSVVEEYNADLVAAAGEGESPDLDSFETLKGQLDHWIDLSIHGEGGEITDSDLLEILTVSGKPEDGRFIYNYTKDGAIADGTPRQKRLTNVRTNVSTVFVDTEVGVEIVDGVLTIPTSRAADVIAQIVKAAKNKTVPTVNPSSEDYDEAFLFPEDISLPITHFKRGIIYTAKINSFALDYYGEISFTIAALVDNALEPTGVDNTLTLEFTRPVFYKGLLVGDNADAPIDFFNSLFKYTPDSTLLTSALVAGDIAVDITGDKTIEFTLSPGFFANPKFKTLDTDKNGTVDLPLTLDLSAFESVDEGPIVVAHPEITLTVTSSLIGTATVPFTDQNYIDTVTHADFVTHPTGSSPG